MTQTCDHSRKIHTVESHFKSLILKFFMYENRLRQKTRDFLLRFFFAKQKVKIGIEIKRIFRVEIQMRHFLVIFNHNLKYKLQRRSNVPQV